MSKNSVITQAAFEELLAWLGDDRDAAALKYEKIRGRLIEIFASRGFLQAEDFADETINRVTLKVGEISAGYVNDPAYYFYAVAKKILLEQWKPKPPLPPPPAPSDSDEVEREHACLERCLYELHAGDRELILTYYREEGRAKITLRQELSRRLGVAPNALRIRIHRIKLTLGQCVEECLGREAA
jgi:DNA-directed RNA polymerase specialized sigma24 family protein